MKMIDQALDKYLPKRGKLARAMRYSIFAGGKRFRPLLCLATAATLGKPEKKVIPFACAVEMIHTFTLIHDDLPAMDNADFRRGKPSSHKVFGEALAILAGDALNTLAFEIIADQPRSLVELSSALLEVVEGQVADIDAPNKRITLNQLRLIHKWKTAALLRACVRGSGIICGASPKKLDALAGYAEHLGLAFQIADDILDATSTRKKLGKPVQADIKKGYPYLIGLERSKKMALAERDSAQKALAGFGNRAEGLKSLAEYVVARTN
ncbi:MAG: polyprenyl synthetase family protein [Candidatus Margulisbacteria bacterium]|nr:polyprenyl synthetase family protein [Candidatus Margulisiibacteriota bacterium]